MSATVFIQVVIIFLLMAIGFILKKTNVLTDKGMKELTDILLITVTPCVLINAYQRDFSHEALQKLAVASVFALVTIVISIVISNVVFKKEETLRYRVSIFGAAYSNCGFMAIPLLTAAMGEDGVFFGSAYLAVFTLMYWTHGICLYSGSVKEISIKKIITNPGIIGVVIALTLFLLEIKLPYVLKETVSYMASLNTPLAMVIMGAYLTQVNVKSAMKNWQIYLVILIRLIITPILAVIIAKTFQMDDVIAKSVLISSACPTASVTTLLANKYKLDAVYATEIVSVATIISIITIPLVIMLY